MNSKDALWFVGKCLSLSVHPERASVIQGIIQSGQVDWKLVVYQSSSQFVMPAFYLNLERANLLGSLPDDLTAHFEEITNLNRERNQSILRQLNNITHLLRENGLKPVYLKGCAHLLDELYFDIAERMIGDIDLLLEEKDAYKAYQILLKNGYASLKNADIRDIGKNRHLPRLIHENEIAAVEIHRKMISGKYDKVFGWSQVQGNLKKSNSSPDAFVLSDADVLLHNMMNVQMNDKAKAMYRILLRQMYDLMLLARNKKPLAVSKSFGHYFNRLNSYIALSADLLDYPTRLNSEENESAHRYLKKIHFIWDNPRLSRFGAQAYFVFFRFYSYFKIFFLFFISSSVRRRLINKLSEPGFFKRHLEQYKKHFS